MARSCDKKNLLFVVWLTRVCKRVLVALSFATTRTHACDLNGVRAEHFRAFVFHIGTTLYANYARVRNAFIESVFNHIIKSAACPTCAPDSTGVCCGRLLMCVRMCDGEVVHVCVCECARFDLAPQNASYGSNR